MGNGGIVAGKGAAELGSAAVGEGAGKGGGVAAAL
jgi:hypothetical protein